MAVGAFFVYGRAFLRQGLIVYLRHLSRVLSFHAMYPSVLSDNYSSFTQGTKRVFCPSPAFKSNVDSCVIPLLNDSSTGRCQVIYLFHGESAFCLQVRSGPIGVVCGRRVATASSVRQRAFLGVFIPRSPPRFFFVHVFRGPANLRQGIGDVVFLRQMVLFCSRFTCILFYEAGMAVGVGSVDECVGGPFGCDSRELFGVFYFTGHGGYVCILLGGG